MAAQGKVTINGRFPTGTTVKLFDRGSADIYAGDANGTPVTSAKTDKNGETTFTAPPGAYFAVAQVKDWNVVTEQHEERVRVIDVTIHSRDVLEALSPAEQAQREAASPEPPAATSLGTTRIIEGARGTGALEPDTPTRIIDPATGVVETFAGPVGLATPAKQRPVDGAAPAPRQEDNRGEALASSTLTGEAVPPQVQPPKQEDAPKNMAQASDTEQGIQVPAREFVRQDEFKGKQASDTPEGTAFPVDPSAPRRSGSGTGRSVHTGSSKPAPASRPVDSSSKRSSGAKKSTARKGAKKGAKKSSKKSATKATKVVKKAAKKTQPRKRR